MSRNFVAYIAIIAASFFSQANSQADSATEGRFVLPAGLVVRPYGYGHFEAGQIESGSLSDMNNVIIGTTDYKINHGWMEDGMASLGFDAIYKRNLEMVVALYTKLYFSYPQIDLAGSRFTKNVRQDVAIDDAFAQYHVGDAQSPLFLAQVGYFKFKYNPDVRNLGEYLFRTGTYPIYFNMSLDFPQERLLGLHFQTNLLKSLKVDLLLTSATVMPTQGWSLSALADYDVARLHFIDIGAGVDFADLLNVYNSTSFPKYFGLNGVGDPVTPRSNNAYSIQNGDTTFYTFAGTKVMARLSIDPKAFIKWYGFGENDLRVYAEADIIGLKDYPDSGYANSTATSKDLIAPSYNVWWQKMPVAIGINPPTFKILDVLNFELEWFAAKYYNDASGVVNYGSNPLPWDWPNRLHVTYAKSQIKWSVYAKRSFFNGHFAIVGQVARDHTRLPCAAYDSESWAELLVTADDWWWALKTSWMF
jgi:hypothetical protein